MGPLPDGESILVLVAYYSRYYEVDILKSTTTEKVISSLEVMFSKHGLPESLTSDNIGPQFISAEFKEYMGWYIRRDLRDVFPGLEIVALTAVRATI